MSVSIDLIRQRWAEPAGFSLARPAGAECYILLHFLTPVELTFDSETRPAPRGALIVFSPGKPHSFYSREPLVHDWMHLSGDVDAMMADYGLMLDTLYLPGVESVVSEITGFLEAEFFTRRAYWPELSEVKLRELFIRAAQSLKDTQPRMHVRAETADRLRQVRAQMLAQPEREWTVEEIAAYANLSPSRLHAVYKAVFGIAPRQDVILMRVEKAKALLMRDVSVTETAARLGYASVYHFIRQFHQTTGVSPKQYVKRGIVAR